MKKNLKIRGIAGAIIGAAVLASLASFSQRHAVADGFYYGPRAGVAVGSDGGGYSPYGYRTGQGGYVYSPYGSTYSRYGSAAYGYEAPYRGTPGTLYYGHEAPRTYNPYGYGGVRAYGGSPYFGHAYAPYGYGNYSPYGY